MLERQIIETLRPYMLQERFDTLTTALATRMRGLTVVLESLYDPGNQAAVFRSADAFGLTDVHIIKPQNATKTSARAVSRGAEKWLDLHKWKSTEACVEQLRKQGFTIAVSDLEAASPLESLNFSKPTAIVFGSERWGVSDAMRASADVRFKIPMRGFVQSYNISVAAALTLHTARQGRERALGAITDLPIDMQERLLARWMRRSVLHSYKLLQDANIHVPRLRAMKSWEEQLEEILEQHDDDKPAIGYARSKMRGRLDQ